VLPEIWIDGSVLAELAGIAPQGVRKAIARGSWHGVQLTVRQQAGNAGSPRYQILLTPDLRAAILRRNPGAAAPLAGLEAQAQANPTGGDPAPLDAGRPDETPAGPDAGRSADPTAGLDPMLLRLTDDPDKMDAVREFLAAPGRRTAEQIARRLGVHFSAIYRWVEHAKIAAATPPPVVEIGAQPITLTLPETRIPAELFAGAISHALRQPRQPLSSAHAWLTEQGIQIDYAHFTRLVKRLQPPFWQLRALAAGAHHTLLLEHTPKIIRAWLNLPSGHTYIGDQHLLDYAAVDPNTGEVELLQLYLWIDATSRYWTGLAANYGPYNQYTVGLSLLDACRLHIPTKLYNDWGRPENSSYIDGIRQRLSGWIDTGSYDDFITEFPDAAIERQHSTPGVPPVKPIEAQMAVLTRYLAAEGLTGYRKRDANPFINKKIQSDLAAAKKSDRLPTVPELLDTLTRVMQRHNTQPARTEEGPTIIPAAVFWGGLRGRRRVMREDDLKLLFFPVIERKVRNACVQVSIGARKLLLTAPALAFCEPSETVRVHWNPLPPHDGALVCRRAGDDWKPYCLADPWAGHCIDPRAADPLAESMRQKQAYMNQFRDALKRLHEQGRRAAGAEEPATVQLSGVTRTAAAKARMEAEGPAIKPVDRQAALRKLAEVMNSR
jgi:hypothetical protein